MTNLLAMTATRPTRTLADGEVLLVQGEGGGDLFILLSGKLAVVRDGVQHRHHFPAGHPGGRAVGAARHPQQRHGQRRA